MKTVIVAGLMALLITPSFGCGCVDAPQAIIAATAMNGNYYRADQALAKSLSNLGETVRESYSLMNNAAMDAEKIARIKKEQAITLVGITFQAERSASLSTFGNKAIVKSVEADLIKAERTSILKAMILNQKSMLED